jgi:hypothetical protein
MPDQMNNGFDSERFRFSMVPVFSLLIAVSALLGVFLALSSSMSSSLAESHSHVVLSVIVIYFLASFGTIWIINWLVPVRVGPEGIHTYNGIGIPVKARWNEITRVSKMTLFPGFTFLYVQHGRDIVTSAYVATFLTDRKGFFEALNLYAGPNHPLTQAYEPFAR